MTITKPNQDLRRDLQGLSSNFKWSAVELMRILERLSQAENEPDAQAVIRICQVMQAGKLAVTLRKPLSTVPSFKIRVDF